ncbi:MAG: hypothetical protein GC156_11530 [Actinomycetales bacterium]|nr:hypothetical protein [Actinomycetales bacterium]
MSRQAWMTVLRVVFLAAAVVFGWWWLRGDWDEVQDAITTVSVWHALVSVVLVIAGLSCTGFVWVRILRNYGYGPPRSVSLPVFFVGQLGKYIPGSVWSFGAQAEMARRHGVPARTTVATGLIFVYWNIVTSALAGAIAIMLGAVDVDIPSWIAPIVAVGAVVGMVPMVVTVVGKRLVKNPTDLVVGWADSAVLLVLMTGAWLAYGLAMKLLTPASVADDAAIPFATFVGAFAISYILGLLVFFAPAGLGVREVSLTVLLTPAMGVGAAAAVALLTRVVHTAGDFGIAAASWGLGRLLNPRRTDEETASP